MTTTLRIALLAGVLALLSNLAVIGFIYWRTSDEAATEVHQQVVEQGKVLSDVYRSGGKAALYDAIQDTISYADPQTAVALLDPHGAQQMGNLAMLPAAPLQEGYRNTLLRLQGQTTPRQSAIVMHRLPTGQWIVSGRIVGEALALRETLERSLFIALIVASLLGLACGGILAHYVGRRVGDIAAVADRIGARDLSQRVPVSSARDAFDRLGLQINAMLDRIGGLMDELRMVTDALAHDLRSPVSRLRSAAHAAAETSDPGGTGRTAQQRHPPGRFADSHPDRGAGDHPVGGADRPQPIRLVRPRRARRRARRNVRAAGRGSRRRDPI